MVPIAFGSRMTGRQNDESKDSRLSSTGSPQVVRMTLDDVIPAFMSPRIYSGAESPIP